LLLPQQLDQTAALIRTIGGNNTAAGVDTLYFNTTASGNTATGSAALQRNTTANFNTATGYAALYKNTTGEDNTANGASALFSNTNTASGAGALYKNEIGSDNTAAGVNALYGNTGDNNIALGASAGYNCHTGNNNIYIGNAGNRADNNKIRIGTVETHKHTFIAGISGSTVAGGVGVIVDADGHLGTVVSSERYKEAIKPMDKASEAILALKPVTFCYKK
jgi:trimeric autotransporter adhesin